jgi:hypothetical protein
MVQHPFQDVLAQRGMCSKGRAPHPMINIGRVEVHTTVALPGVGVGGQHADAKAVAKAGAAVGQVDGAGGLPEV